MEVLVLVFPVRLLAFILFSIMLYLCHLVVKVGPAYIKTRSLLTNKLLFFVFSDLPNSDSESFNPTVWEEQRKHRAQVAFECDEDKDEREMPPRVCAKFPLVFHTILKGESILNISRCHSFVTFTFYRKEI